MKLHNKREQYDGDEINLSSTPSTPFPLLEEWISDAINEQLYDPTAVTLATVDQYNTPSARIVLIKEISEEGVIFFTNYRSRKAVELCLNPNAAMVLYWPPMQRQIRMEGEVKKVNRDKSIQYFQSRPVASQRSAIVSPQSKTIQSKESLLHEVKALETKYGETPHPCPEYWGGYQLHISYFEFWQGQRNRFHDRVVYQKEGKSWRKSLLAP